MPYRLTTIATTAHKEVEVTVIGPGIEMGRRYTFATQPRAQAFVQALNFGFAQGLKEGLELARAGVPSPGRGENGQ